MRIFCLVLFISVFSESLWAGAWKFRAREHYEIHDVSLADQSFKYKGFSNTINFWYEEPFKYSLGLAAGPLLGGAKSDNDVTPLSLGDDIQLFSFGLEFKYFLIKGLFTRPGLSWNHLKSDGIIKKSNGWSPYLGVGYEFLWGSVGIALEAAWRQAFLQNDIEITTFTPSIGVHFYEMDLF